MERDNTIILPNINNWKSKMDGLCWRISKLEENQKVKLDMGKVLFIEPQGLILLFLICNIIYNTTKERVELKCLNPAIYSYLERVNFFEYTFVYAKNKISFWKRYKRSTCSSTLIEITLIKDPIDSANFKEKVNGIIENWYPERANTKYANHVSTIVSEICNNSLEHSGGHDSMGECYCILQKYKYNNIPTIYIAIGDIGLGIRHHLKLKYEWVKDSDVLCIKKALGGLSGRLDNSGGMGLPFIKNMVENYRGSLLIKSGKGVVEYSANSKDHEFQNSLPGTQSLIILK